MKFWALVVLCTLAAIALAGCQPTRTEPYSESEFVGTWQAKYIDHSGGPIHANYGRVVVTGTETFTFRLDGTYQQVFDDGNGYVYTSPWNKWYLKAISDPDLAAARIASSDKRPIPTRNPVVGVPGYTVIYLEGGRFYLDGIETVEKRTRKPVGRRSYYLFPEVFMVTIGAGDSVLYPDSYYDSGWRQELISPEVGDLDDPDSVTYRLVSADAPAASPTP